MSFGNVWHRKALEREIECLVRAHTALRRASRAADEEEQEVYEARARDHLRVARQHRQARNHEAKRHESERAVARGV